MEYLKTQLDAYSDAPQKELKAKRAFIQALHKITAINAAIEESIKDKPTFDALFEKCIAPKAKFMSELTKLPKAISDLTKSIDTVRNARKIKSAKAPKATGGAVTDPPRNIVVLAPADEDPRPAPKPRPAAREPKPAKKKDKITLAMREQIWKKHIGREIDCMCPVCQTRIISMTDFSAGHIAAEAYGGATVITNLVPICGNCNSRMSTENLYTYTWKNYACTGVSRGENRLKKAHFKLV